MAGQQLPTTGVRPPTPAPLSLALPLQKSRTQPKVQFFTILNTWNPSLIIEYLLV